MKQLFLLAVAVAAIAATYFLQAPVAQDPAYHQFADDQTIFDIPNFWNVVSNGLLVLVGFIGIVRSATLNDSHVYRDLRREFGIIFTAALLTGLGSAWYHLAPTTQSLIWDRLPMAIMFTALIGLVISLFISEVSGKLLFWPLVLAGVFSVLYWFKTEQLGAGDLRFYALAQYLSALLIFLIIILFRGMQRPGKLLFASLLFYGIAKAGEHFDSMIYHYTGMISGHTLKHFAAGFALFCIYLILRRRHT